MNNRMLFDHITLATGEQLYGIVDYVSKKHVYFFDFSSSKNPDHTVLALMWRTQPEEVRFSVFCAMNFPQFELPSSNLIHRNNIDTCSTPLTPTPKEKLQRQTITKS